MLEVKDVEKIICGWLRDEGFFLRKTKNQENAYFRYEFYPARGRRLPRYYLIQANTDNDRVMLSTVFGFSANENKALTILRKEARDKIQLILEKVAMRIVMRARRCD